MLNYLIRKLFPKTVEKIATEEADRMCYMMMTGGYIQTETDTDVVAFGMVKVVPKSELREDAKKALDIA